MASELRLTTLANNAGTESVDTTYVINGSAKSWCKFAGTAATVTPDDSLNVSSLDDNSSGNYDINYTNAFGNTHSSLVGTSNWSGVITHDQYTTTYHNLRGRGGATTTIGDRGTVTTATFGDLA
jgi:hypothetical protein